MSLKKATPALLFLTCFIILLYTSYPSIGWWDSGFYAAASKDLGIPSPGGSILFILLGKIFSLLFFYSDSKSRDIGQYHFHFHRCCIAVLCLINPVQKSPHPG